MSRFIQGDSQKIMVTFPDNAIDFILTEPPYLVDYTDRSGRSIANDKNDEWLLPACQQMFRVLKSNSLMVSFYGWNRVDKFVDVWKNPASVLLVISFSRNVMRQKPLFWGSATKMLICWLKVVL